MTDEEKKALKEQILKEPRAAKAFNLAKTCEGMFEEPEVMEYINKLIKEQVVPFYNADGAHFESFELYADYRWKMKQEILAEKKLNYAFWVAQQSHLVFSDPEVMDHINALAQVQWQLYLEDYGSDVAEREALREKVFQESDLMQVYKLVRYGNSVLCEPEVIAYINQLVQEQGKPLEEKKR